MRLTKLGHACVRIEHDGTTVVIDPGVFTEPGAILGADAVLVTHEHVDHWTEDQLRAADLPIFTVSGVAAQLPSDLRERATVVTGGSTFTAGGLGVTAVGEKHAVIYEELPLVDNSGFLLELGDLTLFHPGDALTAPTTKVDVLLLPISAPWLKASECIAFARSVGAARNLAIHDRVYSDAGLGIMDTHLARFLGLDGLDYRRLADGTEL